MPNITSVGLTSGLGTSGTGTVSTLDNLIGTAGTASAQVLTVQGIASGTAQPVSGTVTANATLAAETTKVIGVTRTADGSGNLLTSTSNALDVNIKSGGASGGTSLNDNAAFTAGSTAGTPVEGFYHSTRDTVTDGHAAAIAIDSKRNLCVIPSDGTNNVAVKAASTAAVATDPALVVALSPNGLNANGQAAMAASSAVVVASDQSSVAVAMDTSQLIVGASNVPVTPLFATIAVSASGATTIVSALASHKIRVLALALTANGAVNVKWQSHVTPTDITGLNYFAAAGDGIVLPFNPVGWFQTISGEALDINLSGAVAVGGHITYVEV